MSNRHETGLISVASLPYKANTCAASPDDLLLVLDLPEPPLLQHLFGLVLQQTHCNRDSSQQLVNIQPAHTINNISELILHKMQSLLHSHIGKVLFPGRCQVSGVNSAMGYFTSPDRGAGWG